MAIEEIPAPKKPWQSKTLWLSLLAAVAGFVPSVQKLISDHPEVYGMVIGGVFAALRAVTKGKISIE